MKVFMAFFWFIGLLILVTGLFLLGMIVYDIATSKHIVKHGEVQSSGVQKSETPEGVQTRDMRVPNPPVTFEYVGETNKVQVYTFANHGRRCWVAQAASELAPQVSISCIE